MAFTHNKSDTEPNLEIASISYSAIIDFESVEK